MISQTIDSFTNCSSENVFAALVGLVVATSVFVGLIGPVTAVDTTTDGSALDDMEGVGTQEDPYEITNATELQAMDEDRSAHYVLTDDVDASVTADWNRGNGFDPIGTVHERDAFTGTFDGQNHTISGLVIDRPTVNGVGLFATVDGAIIEDVRLESVDIRGQRAVGSLSGRALETTVSGVVASGDVSAEARGGGGVVGTAEELTLGHSHAAVDVGAERLAGGLVGFTSGGIIEESSASGDVTGTREVGGLVGSNVEGNTVTRTYAIGAVSGETSIGGLVGENVEATVSKSYASGSVDGSDQVGGLVGYNDGSTADLYWSQQASGVDTGIGGAGGASTPLSNDEIDGTDAESNMDSLEFGLVWATTDSYPVLRTEVERLSLRTPQQVITDRPVTATATIYLSDGRTVQGSETADYDTNQSFLSVDRGALRTSGTGMAEVTATVAGHSDSQTVSVVTPPDISIESRELRFDRVGSETAAPVDVTLSNDGGANGQFDVTLSINGSLETTKTVTVQGHSTKTVQVNYSAPAMGSYPVAINGTDLGELTVVEEPETSVASASVSKNLLAVGNATTVETTLENSGDAAAGHTVELTAGGETVATKEVVVPADGMTVSFEYTADSTGEYDLAVSGTGAGTLTVAEKGSVSVESASVPDSIEAGATYEVSVSLANSGGLPLTTEVTYSVGESSVATKTVEVPTDGTTVTLEATAPEDSESIDHAVSAGDSEWTGSTTVTIETATPADTDAASGEGDGDGESNAGDGESDGDSTTSDGGPGFGVVAALVALVALVAATRYRRH